MAHIGTDGLNRARDALIADLAREVKDRRVVDAMAEVPREAFVPEELRGSAYENMPLPIGFGQTISQPLIVASDDRGAATEGRRKGARDRDWLGLSDSRALPAGRTMS